MEQGERFKLFVLGVEEAAAVGSLSEARALIEAVMCRVEDMYSGVPANPDKWRSDGRLYPPQDDREIESPFPGVRVFRTRRHYVLLAENGAIKIVAADRALTAGAAGVIDKPGSDGRRCP